MNRILGLKMYGINSTLLLFRSQISSILIIALYWIVIRNSYNHPIIILFACLPYPPTPSSKPRSALHRELRFRYTGEISICWIDSRPSSPDENFLSPVRRSVPRSGSADDSRISISEISIKSPPRSTARYSYPCTRRRAISRSGRKKTGGAIATMLLRIDASRIFMPLSRRRSQICTDPHPSPPS